MACRRNVSHFVGDETVLHEQTNSFATFLDLSHFALALGGHSFEALPYCRKILLV